MRSLRSPCESESSCTRRTRTRLRPRGDVSVSLTKLGAFIGPGARPGTPIAAWRSSRGRCGSLRRCTRRTRTRPRPRGTSVSLMSDWVTFIGPGARPETPSWRCRSSRSRCGSLRRCTRRTRTRPRSARDVSVSLERLGGRYFSRGQGGDAERALAQFEESLRIRRALYEANPNSAQASRDVCVTLNLTGSIHQSQGRIDDALRLFDEASYISKQVFDANSDSCKQQGTIMSRCYVWAIAT